MNTDGIIELSSIIIIIIIVSQDINLTKMHLSFPNDH